MTLLQKSPPSQRMLQPSLWLKETRWGIRGRSRLPLSKWRTCSSHRIIQLREACLLQNRRKSCKLKVVRHHSQPLKVHSILTRLSSVPRQQAERAPLSALISLTTKPSSSKSRFLIRCQLLWCWGIAKWQQVSIRDISPSCSAKSQIKTNS